MIHQLHLQDSCTLSHAVSTTVCCHAFFTFRLLDLGAEHPILLPHVLLDELNRIAKNSGNDEIMYSSFATLLRTAVEVVVKAPCVALALRPKAGSWLYVVFQVRLLMLGVC